MKIQIYNPGNQGIFAVSSVLVTSEKDALLIDTQFSTKDAANLVAMIRACGKRLTAIYISCGDPDFYFGTATIKAAFPNVAVFATLPVIDRILKTHAEKLKVWSPLLGDAAPTQVIIPEPLKGSTLYLEREVLEIIGLDSPLPDRTFVWIPFIRSVVGSVPVFGNQHLFLADTPTQASHSAWLATLQRILALRPETVVPGHFAPGTPMTIESVNFTTDYIKAFDKETSRAKNAADLIAALQNRFPNLAPSESLNISARVAKSELAW
jgi:glyoxylase-like metal-dependent hydrolase (beta-lactamase superfamily II)